MSDWTGELQAAVTAARAAAVEHQRFRSDKGISSKSTDIDLVTRADVAAEDAIRSVLLAAFPDDAILGEEGGEAGDGARRWVVDPLDGTLNYAHDFPYWAVSIALEADGELVVAVVLDVCRDELFTAIRGQGARRNGDPIAVSTEPELRRSMLATGFAYQPAQMAENLVLFSRLLPLARAIRRPGAAALDLAAVACGRYDGFWELYLQPWDVAAGTLLIREAGGRVTDGSGADGRITDRMIVASNGALHPALLGALGES